MPRPLVSVCIITYQHAPYIAQAIEGALQQQAGFPTEILIGEDGSTDGTREICQQFAAQHPGQIRLFCRERKNLSLTDGRPDGNANFLLTLREARGEFVAICEGDDYWTDPSKLSRQIAYLRANQDCAGCFHDAQLVDPANKLINKSYFQSSREKYDQRAALETLLSAYPTCSLLYRRAAFDPVHAPRWYLRRPCDFNLDLVLTASGQLGFISDNMAAYRVQPGGRWSGKRMASQMVELIVRYKLLLEEEDFQKYRELLWSKIDEFERQLFTANDGAKEIKRLAATVDEQTAYIKRLKKNEPLLLKQIAGGQQAIDALRSQLDALAGTSREQTEYIAVLEKERYQRTADSRKLVDGLHAQLDALANTSRKQTEYIAVLEKERNELSVLAKAFANDCEHYTKVIAEQTSYIMTLETQRLLVQPQHEK